MKKVSIIVIIILLASTMISQGRETRTELNTRHLQERIEKRKRIEKRDAAIMVSKAQKRVARKKREREQAQQVEIQAMLDIEAQVHKKDAYRQEVRHFNQLIQELNNPLCLDRPMLDIVHEADLTLQALGSYNQKSVAKYQERLEHALRNGTHPIALQTPKQFSNTELIARESIQSLVSYTKTAMQLVEETAIRAEEIAARAKEIQYDLSQTINNQRSTIATLSEQLNKQVRTSENYLQTSEKRIQDFNTQLVQAQHKLKKAEDDALQKEGEAVSLSQSIDAFNTVASKLNNDRIVQAEKKVRALEEQALSAAKHLEALTLHVQATEKAFDALEDHAQQMRERQKKAYKNVHK